MYVKPPSLLPTGSLHLTYDKTIDNFPKHREFLGPVWGAEAATVDVGDPQVHWMELAGHRLEDELVMGTLDNVSDINLAVWNGTTWGNLLQFTTNANKDVKVFDIAYESLSGEALVVGRTGFSSAPLYTVWGFGTGWAEHLADGAFNGAYSVHGADMDGDGDIDILGAAEIADDITWWENDDGFGGSWTEHTIDPSFNTARSVLAVDIDGDGDMDVLGAAYTDDDITWWENTNGLGTAWTEHTIDGAFDGAWAASAADIDGDGDMDVLGAAFNADDITWWENTDGVGTAWTEHTIDANFNGALAVNSADVDGDGDLDVLGTGYWADQIAWWENDDGAGTAWTKHTIQGGFGGARSVYAADVDGDGDVDVLGAAFDADEVSWWENTDGTGTAWTKHVVKTGFNAVRSVYIVDLDSDGDQDFLAASSAGDLITWWENLDGTGVSLSEQTIDGSVNGASSIYVADINGDGKLDVLSAANVADDVSWWEVSATPTKFWVYDPPAVAPDTGGGILRWIEMESKPSADEILIAILDWDRTIYLSRWGGAGFTDLGVIEWDAATRDRQVMDIAYEQQSGDALIVWGKGSSDRCRYRIWDGTTLSATAQLPVFGSSALFVRAVADPESDSILVVAADSAGDLNVALWDGDAWTDSIELETSLYANDRQVFDVAWEDSGDEAVVVWSNSTSNQVQYWRWSKGTAFASGTSLIGPDFQAALSTMRLSKISETVQLALLGVNVNGELYSTLWDGDSFVQSPPTLLSTSVSEPTKTAFDMAEVNTGN
ncbi:MAG: VCBS repeat-containing protein [Candidatus Hydrogenedentes bacterium]|nr:VCBS repeat-containing protein [Candidatus Hydrogenedentota bacterium]